MSAWYLSFGIELSNVLSQHFPWLRSSYFSYLSFNVKISDIFKHIIPSIPGAQYFSISRINFQMWSMLCMSFVYYFICSPYFWYYIPIFYNWLSLLWDTFWSSFLLAYIFIFSLYSNSNFYKVVYFFTIIRRH